MPDSLTQTFVPCAIATANVLLLMWTGGQRRPLSYVVLKCAAFATLTVAMLRYGIVPTQAVQHIAEPDVRFVRGALEMGWWLLAAATIMSVVRTYYAIGLRLRQHRFFLDVVATLLYLGAALATITDILDIPLKGVLATSGALAIVLGLALQSTLSDLFSGLLINATSPYRVGDSVTLDDSTEGEVVEITWRATHIGKANRDLVVVPNSSIAKSRIINRSVPNGPHATVVKFETDTRIRPSDVVHALELAINTCVGIAPEPKPEVSITAAGRKATSYQITFFKNGLRSTIEVTNKFYDAAHRHLESLSALVEPLDGAIDETESDLPYRLVASIGVFGMLTRAQRARLVGSLVRRELAPDQVILAAGERSRAITIVGYGIVGAVLSEDNNVSSDLTRFGPREYFGESGPIAGVESHVSYIARTYVVAYELPDSTIEDLLKENKDIAHAFAAKLAERIRRGEDLMRTAPEFHASHSGLIGWISRCISAIHRSADSPNSQK